MLAPSALKVLIALILEVLAAKDIRRELREEIDEVSEMESVDAYSNLESLNELIEDTKSMEMLILEHRDDEIKPVNYELLTSQVRENHREGELVDDFIRNFFIKKGLSRSLQIFQQEWYEAVQKGMIDLEMVGQIPNDYVENQKMEERIDQIQKELNEARLAAKNARATWDKLKKDQQNHRMHHKRVLNEKKALNDDINKLKNLHTIYEQKYQELSTKYEAAMKDKMNVKIDRDKLLSRKEALTATHQTLKEKYSIEDEPDIKTKQKKPKGNALLNSTRRKTLPKKLTPIPNSDKPNPFLDLEFEMFPSKNVSLSKSYKGHMMSISNIAVHPRKAFIATASDDLTWKIWGVPNGELIMSGEGHRDWISGVDFNPNGIHLCTSSGDGTVRIWDFVNLDSSTTTFVDHIQPVWSINYHHTGDFIVTGCMDHSSKLLDVAAEKSRGSFSGHVDSVNRVKFLPFSNVFASASADKTLSLWDIRSKLCVQTFYGHENSVNSLDVDAKVVHLIYLG